MMAYENTIVQCISQAFDFRCAAKVDSGRYPINDRKASGMTKNVLATQVLYVDGIPLNLSIDCRSIEVPMDCS